MANELPARGHNEHDDSANSRNWNNFISLMLKTNPRYKQLNKKLDEHNKHAVNYYSKTSFNGFASVIADQIRLTIAQEIQQTQMFTILIDKSKDLGKHEELALCV